ncbi:hypothetical protein ANN_15623 [Periplaneta americana]|uniref:Reverse transcriptase domain-containing protein n=1 Tax=Periplaneta americana TaxID=6978 RepID=A0ABQ8SGV4_PERAM|nr:hypothetical protein ANN_15623 [Periplaneta americana]
MAKEYFNRKRNIFCGTSEKELRKRLVKCFVWSVTETWTLRRSEEKRLEAFKCGYKGEWSMYNSLPANEVLGKKERTKEREWFDEECKIKIGERNIARLNWLRKKTRASADVYKEKKKEAKSICRRKKREYFGELMNDLNEGEREGTREFYARVKHFKKGFKPRVDFCQDEEGKLIVPITSGYEGEQQFLPGKDEVLSMIDTLKNNKTPGEDGITAELIKYGGEKLKLNIVRLVQNTWRKENIPEDWRTSIFCPIYKKGDKTICANYRGIALLDIVYKVVSKLKATRMNKILENIVGEYQGGFIKGKSTTDQIFVLRTILEKCYEYNTDLHLLFADFKEAYDSIDRNSLIEILIDYYVPRKLIRLTQMTLKHNKGRVVIQNEIAEEFKIEKGVKQGDPLSTILFNIALERVVRNLDINPGGTIYNRMVQILACADDVVIIIRSTVDLQRTLLQLVEEGEKLGLSVNQRKTKYMIATRNKNKWGNSKDITIGDYNFERVTNFKYLGSIITEDNNTTAEIKERLKEGNRCYWALLQLMRSRHPSKAGKIKIYRTVLRPIVTYASETWSKLKEDENRIAIWERKILRRIYGPKLVNGEWRLRYNSELYELYGKPSILGEIKSSRLKWLGHVERREENSLLHRIYRGNPGGRRCTGRPRKAWMKDVEEDMKELGIRTWRRRARDRNDWASLVRQALVLQGL